MPLQLIIFLQISRIAGGLRKLGVEKGDLLL